jgi:multiple sugar transport system ATP-binding protein
MIYVTHDQVEAMTLGDRIVVMDKGRILQVAEPIELYDRPVNRFVAGFIGTPPMNFMDGWLERDDGSIWFRNESARLRLPPPFVPNVGPSVGRKVLLGVRPESLRERADGEQVADGTTLKATVNVLEPLGDQIIVYLLVGAQDLIARLDAHSQLRLNQNVEMVVTMGKAHVFDEETGANLTAAAERN